MKRHLRLLLLCAGSVLPATASHKQIVYDHTGKMVYHAPKVRNLLDGRTDLYYDGDYTCTPGTEHYAPDCRTIMDWVVTEAESYSELFLDDDRRIVLTSSLCTCDVMPELCKRGPDGILHSFTDEQCRKREQWKQDDKTVVLRRRGGVASASPWFELERELLYCDPNPSDLRSKLLSFFCDPRRMPQDGMTKTFAYRVLTSKVGQRHIEIEGFIQHIDF